MGRVLAIANQKGGVGKTTTTVNLAASLVLMKKKVMLVDLDPQGNATMGSGIEKNDLDHTVYDVLAQTRSLQDVILRTPQAGYDILPANGDLTAAEVELLKVENRLKEILAPVKAHYDYILIDCPPSLNMLTVNALAAADGVLIPMQCEYYALEGLSALSQTIHAISESINPDLVIEGILRTMFDARNKLTEDVSAQLHEYFADKVYRTVIPRNVRLAEAPSFGLPIIVYDKASRGALAYIALAGEILRKSGNEQTTTV
ncbi:MAG: AAA family ATPase [Pseudomonadales bacterium]|nr:AAA family ATPase [Pseudomonadales bacterium]